MKDNKGFSLVELIVVIAIMSILTGVSVLSIRSATGTYVKQCTANIESQINNTRHMTMAKNKVKLKIYVDSNGVYYADMEVYASDSSTTPESTTTTKVGKSSVDVYFTTDTSMADTSFKKVDSTNPIIIEFDRSSGALKDTTNCVKQIKISKGAHTKRITIYPETGKISVKTD